MTLLQAWVDSVSLLKPKNLKLFLLVTVKSIIEAYKIVFIYWSWLIALIGVYLFIAPSLEGYMAIGGRIVSFLLYQLLLFGICLSTRPSVMQKDCAYFRSYMRYFVYVALVLLFFSLILIYHNPFFAEELIFSPGHIFSILFFLDSKNEFEKFLLSLWHGLEMVVYNLPLILVIKLVLYIPVYLFFGYTSFNFATYFFIGALVMPIPVCTYTNIYIKKLHDQFDLYFKQPK